MNNCRVFADGTRAESEWLTSVFYCEACDCVKANIINPKTSKTVSHRASRYSIEYKRKVDSMIRVNLSSRF
ncbi:hypothetical protein ACFFH4_13040 [Halalkalibacter alkalisediminis]|uniref:Transposase n=1 Tax=Halalkalibacter alkalisediminis TaxID=935616 RepID=A0ABV6NGT5_9BACI